MSSLGYQDFTLGAIYLLFGNRRKDIFCFTSVVRRFASASSAEATPTAFGIRHRLRLPARVCLCDESPGRCGEMDPMTLAKTKKTVRTT